jgi:hypothetical protein
MKTVTIPETPIKRALDRTEFSYLESLDPPDRLLALFRCILGAETWDNAEQVNPTRIKIPRSQWVALCDADTMSWMNVGPSGYDDAPLAERANRGALTGRAVANVA